MSLLSQLFSGYLFISSAVESTEGIFIHISLYSHCMNYSLYSHYMNYSLYSHYMNYSLYSHCMNYSLYSHCISILPQLQL